MRWLNFRRRSGQRTQALSLGIDGILPGAGLLNPGALYAVRVEEPSARQALVAKTLHDALAQGIPAVIVAADPGQYLAALQKLGVRTRSALRRGHLTLFGLTEHCPERLEAFGAERFLAELESADLAPHALLVFDGADGLFSCWNPATSFAQGRKYRDWMAEWPATGLFLFHDRWEELRGSSPLEVMDECFAGIGTLLGEADGFVWAVSHWTSALGTLERRRLGAHFEPSGNMLVADGSESELWVPGLDEIPPDPSAMTLPLDHAEGLRVGGSSAAAVVGSGRTAGILMDPLGSGQLDRASEGFQHSDIDLAAKQAAVGSGVPFGPLSAKGYLPLLPFCGWIRQALANTARLTIQHALVHLPLKSEQRHHETMPAFRPERRTDFFSFDDRGLCVFLFACAEAELDRVLDQTIIVPRERWLLNPIRFLTPATILAAVEDLESRVKRFSPPEENDVCLHDAGTEGGDDQSFQEEPPVQPPVPEPRTVARTRLEVRRRPRPVNRRG